jgi:lysophospholipase L1-like esterase
MRNSLINGGLILFAVVLTCAVLELVLALFLPQSAVFTSSEQAFFIKFDPTLGWINRAGVSGVYRPAPGIPPTFVRINNQGYRGEEMPLQKPAGKRRILVIGDSNTFGYGVEESSRFTDIMAARLSPGAEVFNFGVFGYGTDQEVLLAERDAVRYHPDILLLAVSAGDLADNISSINGGTAKPFFRYDDDILTLCNSPVSPAVPYMRTSLARSAVASFCYRHSHLFRFIMKRVTPVSRYMVNSVAEMSEAQGLKVMKALLQSVNDLCTTQRTRFVVVLIPHGEWLEGARRMPGGKIGYFGALASALEESGIPFVDATGALAAADNGDTPVFFPKDPVHLTSYGHQVVARVVSGFLADRKLTAR